MRDNLEKMGGRSTGIFSHKKYPTNGRINSPGQSHNVGALIKLTNIQNQCK